MRSLSLASVITSVLISNLCFADITSTDNQNLVPGYSGQVQLLNNELVLTLPKKVHFNFDSKVLDDFASANDLISFMKAFEAPLVLTIEGHTDSVGMNDYNKDLSKKRALELKEFLLSQGVSEDSVEIKAMSNANLIEKTDQPSRVNRRLELSLSYK